MGDIATGAIISGGSQLAGGILDRIYKKKDSERELAQNKELQDYQYNKDLDMWNRQNVYNSPEEQMKRLKTGGLNPNLAYGSGSVAGNTSGQVPKYQAPQANFSKLPSGIRIPEIGSILNQYMDLETKEKSNRAIEEDIKLKQQDSIMKGIQRDAATLGLDKLKQDIGITGELNLYNRQSRKIDMEGKKQEIRLKGDTWNRNLETNEQVLRNLKQEELVKGGRVDMFKIEKQLKQLGITGMQLENKMKQINVNIKRYAENMANQNINPNSPAYQQGIMKILDEAGLNFTSKSPTKGFIQNFLDNFKKQLKNMGAANLQIKNW